MRLFLGVSVACLLSLSSGVTDVLAQENVNTNISASGSLNAVGIDNSNAQSQTQIGSINDSFKTFDLAISESFRVEGNDTDLFSDNTTNSMIDSNHNFKDNTAFNSNSAIDNNDNLNDNTTGNQFSNIDNDENFSDNAAFNTASIIDNDDNTINP